MVLVGPRLKLLVAVAHVARRGQRGGERRPHSPDVGPGGFRVKPHAPRRNSERNAGSIPSRDHSSRRLCSAASSPMRRTLFGRVKL